MSLLKINKEEIPEEFKNFFKEAFPKVPFNEHYFFEWYQRWSSGNPYKWGGVEISRILSKYFKLDIEKLIKEKVKRPESALKVIEALQSLYDKYDPIIQNWAYRGPMQKIPSFTMKMIKNELDCLGKSLSIPTIRKWCHFLKENYLLEMFIGKCYFANDPETYQVYLKTWQPIKLRWNKNGNYRKNI